MRRPTGIQEVAGSILGSGTIFPRDLVISMDILALPLIQVNRLGSLPRNSVDRLTDCTQNDRNSVEEP